MFRTLDLFSGIGGFSLGLERTGGFRTVAFCESSEFCQRVLKKNWPEVPIFHDVRFFDESSFKYFGGKPDVICGGFPCQDISLIGKRAGLTGERSSLWREFARIVRRARPAYVIVENVAALVATGLDDVLGDLAALGYDSEWHCIPAFYAGAAHVRDRVWIIAYPAAVGRPQILVNEFVPEASSAGQLARMGAEAFRQWPAESVVCRGRDAVPNRMDRVAALGNAVVPQIPEMIGRRILAADPA